MEQRQVPGPGAYEVPEKTIGPRYSFSGRQYPKLIKGQFKLKVPGVGAYEIRKEESMKAPCCKIGLESRTDLSLNKTALNNPAPNKYNLKLSMTATMTPKWSFSKSERFEYNKEQSAYLKRTVVPGPGKYDLKGIMGTEGPKYSFTKEMPCHNDRYEETILKRKKNFPCPGTYIESNKYSPSGPIYSIPKLKRKENGSDKCLLSNPGPEKYNPEKKFSSTFTQFPKWSITKSNKDEDTKVEGSKKIKIIYPGPGTYCPKNGTIPSGPKFTMRQILKKFKKDITPGPGQYKISEWNKPSEPKYSIGKETREEELKLIKKLDFPGPGQYKVHDVNLTKQFTFPKEKRAKVVKLNLPGPGRYKIPTSFDYINNMTREKADFDISYKYV